MTTDTPFDQPADYENESEAALYRDALLWRQHAEALWAVRVLDAWADKHNAGRWPQLTCMRSGGEWWLRILGNEVHYASDPDAARIAAATALIAADPTLEPSHV